MKNERPSRKAVLLIGRYWYGPHMAWLPVVISAVYMVYLGAMVIYIATN